MPLPKDTLVLHGRYRIDDLLGEGASAEVYLATQLKLRAPRALKILRRAAAGGDTARIDEYRARFELEGELQEKLGDNPGIVRVFDTDEHDGAPVLVMEYLPGKTLKTAIQALGGQGMPWLRCAEVLRDVASGLQALHEKRSVHRDVKPSNVLFTANERDKLGDLGVAQTDRTRTRTDGRAHDHPGTPGYASPEHADGRVYLTPAADVYALGVMGFEMLTGRLPHLSEEARAPTVPVGDAPAWLKALIQRMLAWDHRERPQEGGAVAEEISRELLSEAAREAQRAARAKSLRSQIDAALAAGELGPAADLLDELQALTPNAPESLKLERRVNLAILGERMRLADDEARRKADEAAQLKREEEERRRLADIAAEQKRLADEAARQKREEEERQRAAAAAEARRKAEAGQIIRRTGSDRLLLVLAPGLEMEFVHVPAGDFLYGDDKEKRRTDAFWIGRAPVTTAHFLAFIGESGYKTADVYYASKVAQQQLDHPAKLVNWDEAQAWCAWASAKANAEIRLPNEVEWEKAARGTDGRTYPWGNAKPTERHVRFREIEAYLRTNGEDDWKLTTPVGQLSPVGDSPYGLVDVTAHVSEWCADWYDAEQIEHVFRGGSFGGITRVVDCAFRFGSGPDYRDDLFGFRVILRPPSLDELGKSV